MFRFYLDNTLVSDPINWSEFTETIEFDQTLKALLPKYDVKLSFVGDAYDYIYSQFQTNGFCNLIELKVDYECSPNEGYATELKGYIFISDCKFNLNKCIVECDIIDNNYGAKIFNNKSIKAYLNVARSKNDVAIAVCTFDSVQTFIPTTGVYSGASTRKCWKVSDAFRYLVHFMTDGAVGFESTFLTTLTEPFGIGFGIAGLRITTGHELRVHDQSTAPFISFQELFHEIDIKYPLGFTMISVAGVPTIKIEDAAYFQNETVSITVSDINDLKQSFNNELLYSTIKFGSTYLDYDGFQYNYPQIRFFNFADEEYHLQGECNIDKALDLTGFIISDTNTIEGCVATDVDNETYDGEIFFIQTWLSGVDRLATEEVDPVLVGLPYYYNANLQNNKIAERYNLQGNIALYLGNNNDAFRSENTSNQDVSADFTAQITNSANVFSSNVAFQNDSTGLNFDTNGNYNNTLFKFVSPANGNYNLESNIIITQNSAVFGAPGATATLLYQVVFNVYSGGGGFLRSEYCPQYNYVNSPSNSQYNIFGSKNIYIPAGGYVVAVVSVISTSVNQLIASIVINATSYFLCNQTFNGGGVYDYAAPSDYFISRFEFDAPLSKAQYDLMKADLSMGININNDGQNNRLTWIRKTIRNFSTSEMTWEQISSKTNSR